MKIGNFILFEKKATKVPPVIYEKDVFSNFFSNYSYKTAVTIEDAFANLTFSIIWKRANILANESKQKSTLFLESGNNEIPADKNNWLSQLMNNKPNGFYNWWWTKALLQQWLDYFGNAYLYTPVLKGFPNRAYVLPANKVKPMVTSGIVTSYLVRHSATKYQIDAKEIAHFKTMQPDLSDWNSNFISGTPMLLNASVASIGADKELIEYVHEYFLRSAVSPFIVSFQEKKTTEELEKWKAMWEDKVKEYPVVAAVDGGASVAPLTGSDKNSSFGTLPQIDDTIIVRLGNIWGIAPALITSNFNARATMEVLEQQFYKNTIDPLLTDFESVLTEHFRQWDTRVKFNHEPLTYTDPNTIFERRMKLIEKGILNRDEIRLEVGLEAIPDGDIYLLPSNITTIEKITQEPSEPEPEEEPEIIEEPEEDAEKAFKKIDNIKAIDFLDMDFEDIPESFKLLFWHKFDKIARKYEKNLESSVVDSYEEIHKTINLDNFYNLFKSDKPNETKYNSIVTKWENIFVENTSEPTTQLIIAVLKESLIEVGENPVDYGLKDLKSDSDFIKELKRLVKDSTDKIKISANTTAEETGKLIKQVVEDNPLMSKANLLKEIETRIDSRFNDVYTKSRSAMIAQTSATYSTGSSQTLAWKQVGLKMSWLTQRDSKVRSAHRKADGQKKNMKTGMYKVDDEFLTHPAAGTKPENNVNCRCSQFPSKK